jgi:O-antigen ligase
MPYLLAAAIAAIALILTPGIFFSFDVTPKLIVLLAAAAMASYPVRRSKFLWLALATLVSLAVSTALSPRPELSFYGSEWRRYGLLAQLAILLLAWSLSGQARRTVSILRVLSAAGAVTAIYGIAQYLGWDPILPAAAYHVGEGTWTIVRPPSTLGYVSYFATWLVFVVFLSLAVPGRISKAVAVLAVTAMVLTGTRAALLGVAAGAAVWCFWRGVRVSRRVVGVALAVVALAGAFYVSPLGQPMRIRARWFAEDPWGGARPLLWRDSLRMGLARPVAGHGPETFTATFPHYETRELARAYPDFAHESPHNIFLDALVAQGIPGMMLLMAWCALGFTAAWRIRVKHPAEAAGMAAALAGGIVSQQFTVFTIPTAVIFFATIALADGLAGESSAPPRYIPFALPLLYFAARIAFVDHALALTQRDLAAGDVAAAGVHYEASGYANDLWYSRRLQSMRAFSQSAAAAERATRTSESPFNAWYSLSGLRAVQNDAAGTERCLRNAIAAHPSWFKPHWTLAQLLRLEGRTEEARREALLAADLDGGKHPEVARTVAEVNSALKRW